MVTLLSLIYILEFFMLRIAFILFVPFFLINSANAEFKQDMETDRPDFTEGTQTITPGHFQFEMGYTYTHDDEAGTNTEDHTFPEIIARVGISDNLEFRYFWPGWSFTDDEEGGTDFNFGFKTRLIEDGPLTLSLLSDINVPTGAESKSSDKVEPAVKFLWAQECSDNLSIAGNFNFSVPVDEEKDYYFEPSASFSIAPSLTETIGAYFEYFGFYPANIGVTSTHYLNGGLTYAMTSNIQLDARVGFGLNEDADDFFTGTGLSFRY